MTDRQWEIMMQTLWHIETLLDEWAKEREEKRKVHFEHGGINDDDQG